MIQLNHFSKKNEFIATGTGISMNGKVTKSVYCRFSSILLKYTDSGFKKSSFGSQNKMPIFNRKIRNLMISRSLLSESIHRLIKHYSILVIIQISQHLYLLEGEYRGLTDSHPPVSKNCDCFFFDKFFKRSE